MELNKKEKEFLLGLLQKAKEQTLQNHYEVVKWFIDKTITSECFDELKKAYDEKVDFLIGLEQKLKGSDEK